MRRGWVAVLVFPVLALAVPIGPALAGPADEAVYARVAPGIVGIKAQGVEGGYYGTGAVIHPDGYVLTTTGVIPMGGTNIEIYHHELGKMDARLVNADARLELSLAKIEGPGDFTPLPFGDSDEIELGEAAYTIGNTLQNISQFGRPSMSAGVVSGFLDVQEGAERLATYRGEMIETSAALNGGVDGGPLLDSGGNIIGLLSLNYVRIRRLGTAIPVNAVRETIRAWIEQDGGGLSESVSLFPRREPRFKRAMERVGPSVVAIEVGRGEEGPGVRPPENDRDSPFIERVPGPVTGFAVSENEILTTLWNIHGGEDAVTVVLADGRRFPAEVLGWNGEIDVALLRVEGDPALEPVEWDTEPVLGGAVGVLGHSPQPDRLTITTGIVSGLHRRQSRKMLQIDALLNYGNAGGPVVTVDGRVVSIAAQVTSMMRESQNSGVGYSARADAIVEALPGLRAGERTEAPAKAFLGVGADQQRMQATDGAHIGRVWQNSAGAAAGLQQRDVIIEFDGIAVGSWNELLDAIKGKEVGDEIIVVWMRNGERMEGRANLTARP